MIVCFFYKGQAWLEEKKIYCVKGQYVEFLYLEY